MLSLNELVDIRMQQHIAQEIYRQQIMQRIPDPFSSMLPMHMPHHVIMPPRPTLPNVNAKLENNDLWQQFHKIGTEMIITKTGRRMFPSQRLSLSGLEEDASYCVLLEMLPTGDCRYKFSGSQWVPAGGAEPQSPQRMYLHPDSPATGAHWQSQPILFNKVKLTNNTLDHIGHIVLASMHKYQPRIHVIRTSDLTQIPWAPQRAFVFAETEFVAVTAYQNDRITKLKIDNNPFAKGFRETGQSRCKRKLSATEYEQQSEQQIDRQCEQLTQRESDLQHDEPIDVTIPATSPSQSICSNQSADDDRYSVSSSEMPQVKRSRSNGSLDDAASLCSSNGSQTLRFDEFSQYPPNAWLMQQQALHQMPSVAMPLDMTPPFFLPTPAMRPMLLDTLYNSVYAPQQLMVATESACLPQLQLEATAATYATSNATQIPTSAPSSPSSLPSPPIAVRSANKRCNFSISAILAH